MKRLLVLPTWALLAPGLAIAATPAVQLSAPVLGYVFDPTTQAIRQVTGVPGAASLDGVVAGSLKAAWVDSSARLAIAVTKDDATAVVNWRGAEAQMTALDTGLGSLKSASFSASGDVAVLSDGSAVEIWLGLASTPAKVATYVGEGGVTAAAARNNGSAAVAMGGGNIVLVAGDSSHVIATGGGWKALAFLGGSSDLLAASAGSLTKLTGVDANPGQSTVASIDGEPSAMVIAADGTKAALAVGGDLLMVSLQGGLVLTPCGCEASHLSALAGNLVAHVASQSKTGTTVLDADAPEPRVFVVPEGGAQ